MQAKTMRMKDTASLARRTQHEPHDIHLQLQCAARVRGRRELPKGSDGSSK
jgi:hypothetical protein